MSNIRAGAAGGVVAMSKRMRFCVPVVAVLAVAGCGGGSESSVDPNQPVEGRALRKASELEGVWLALNEGAYLGLEFMDDGRALATHLAAGQVFYNYSVLDDGRLALIGINGGGQEVYESKIDGDRLELEGFINSQRFMRLADGQTLEQGIEEQSRLREAEYEKRHDALTAWLGEPGLVIAPSTPSPNGPAPMAVQYDGQTGMGQAWYDEEPPHLNQLRIALDSDRNRPVVNVTFGMQLRPPTTNQSENGSITFATSGDDFDNPTLLAQVNYGGQDLELALRRDRGQYDAIIERFDAAMAREDALRKPITDLLKEVAVLDGVLASEGVNANGYRDRIALTRDPQTGLYSGSSVWTNADTGQSMQYPAVSAEIAIIDDAPMLIISNPVYQYQLSADAGKLTGGYFRQGFNQGYAAEFTIVRATDAATLARENQAQRAALLEIDASRQYVGFVNNAPSFDYGQVPVAVLTITPQANETFTAMVRFPGNRLTERMTGRIVDTLDAGPLLELSYVSLEADEGGVNPAQLGPIRGQVWTLDVGEPVDGRRTLVGSATNLGPLEFHEMTAAWRAAQMRAFTEALTAGVDFRSKIPDDAQTVLRLKLDPATMQISGQMVAPTGQNRGYDGTPYNGELLTETGDGLPLVTVSALRPEDGFFPLNVRLSWVGIQVPEGLLLTGILDNVRARSRYQSEYIAPAK
jgi:hypothetical protein